MAQDTSICRLCLNIIKNDVPFSPIRTNNNVLHNLNLVFFDTTKNLELTEDPIICDSCDITLQEIATFKEHIISNESQMTKQSIQHKDLNLFLKAISKDVDNICRLCLTHFEDTTLLQKSLIECNGVITKCNIDLKLDIPIPSKICIKCDQSLQKMSKFVLNFSDNEAKIDDLAKKKKKLTNKDICEIKSITAKEPQEKIMIEDNNNVLPKENEQEIKTNNNINNVKKSSKKPAEVKSKKIQSMITSFTKSKSLQSTKVSKKDKQILPESSAQNNKDGKGADPEILVLRKSPRTYTRTLKNKKTHLKQCFPSNVRFRTQSEPSTSKSSDCDTIIITDVSIDTLPVEDLADITLDNSLQMQHHRTDPVSSDNVTLELIDLMEETEFLTENGHGVNYQYKTAEELLKVLEDSADESMDDNINKPNGHINEKEEKSIQGEQNKRKKATELKPISKKGKTVTKKDNISVTNVQINGSGSVEARPKKHNLRQKSVITSFRDMLNMKPIKNKSTENSETPKVTASPLNDGGDSAKEGNNEQTDKEFKRNSAKGKKIKGTSPLNDGGDSAKEGNNEQTDKEFKRNTAKGKTIKGTLLSKVKKQEQENNVEGKKRRGAPRKATGNKAMDAEKKSNPKTAMEVGILEEIPSTSSLSQSDRQKTNRDEKQRDKNKIENSNENAMQMQADMPADSGILMNEDKNQSKNKKRINRTYKKKNLQGQETVVAKGPVKKLAKQKNLEESLQERKENNLEKLEGENTKVSSNADTEEEPQIIDTTTIKEVIVNKRAKRKTNLKEPDKEIPKKRTKKITQKTSDETEQTKENTTSKNDAQVTATESEGEDADSEDSDQATNRSVVVMIRRQKRTNKLERDKTWSALTGIKIKTEKALEPAKVPKKRGRPRLPEDQRKEKKPKPIYYLCRTCPFKSISQHIITQHEFIHNIVEEVAVYKCGQCTFRSNNKEILAQHKEAHLTRDLIFKCMFCDFSAQKKTKTMYHMLRHDDEDVASLFYCLVINRQTEEEYYECYQCEYENPEESLMPDHVIEHQIVKIKNPTLAKFTCNECGYKTKFDDMFKRHQEAHEKKRELLAKKKANKKEDLEKVVKKEHPEKVVKTEPKEDSQGEQSQGEEQEGAVTVYSCDLCRYLTYNKRSLANHKGLKHNRAQHATKKPDEPGIIYKCNECVYTTPKKPHLARHILVHRSKENMEFLECPHCFFETKHRRSYTRHMEIRHKVIV